MELDPEEDEVKVAGVRLMLVRGRLSWSNKGGLLSYMTILYM